MIKTIIQIFFKANIPLLKGLIIRIPSKIVWYFTRWTTHASSHWNFFSDWSAWMSLANIWWQSAMNTSVWSFFGKDLDTCLAKWRMLLHMMWPLVFWLLLHSSSHTLMLLQEFQHLEGLLLWINGAISISISYHINPSRWKTGGSSSCFNKHMNFRGILERTEKEAKALGLHRYGGSCELCFWPQVSTLIPETHNVGREFNRFARYTQNFCNKWWAKEIRWRIQQWRKEEYVEIRKFC